MGIVVMSALNDAVPTGVSSGSMSGMSMPVGHGTLASLTIRDIDGRPVRLMGRPGVVVFVNAASCDHCVAAVRVAGRAVRRSPGNPALTVVAAASATSRDELLAFAHSTGLPSAHYVVDDRNGTLASKLGASGLGSAVVYDGQGVIVAHPNASLDLVAAALRSARRR